MYVFLDVPMFTLRFRSHQANAISLQWKPVNLYRFRFRLNGVHGHSSKIYYVLQLSLLFGVNTERESKRESDVAFTWYERTISSSSVESTQSVTVTDKVEQHE